jgi:hypothetical protein
LMLRCPCLYGWLVLCLNLCCRLLVCLCLCCTFLVCLCMLLAALPLLLAAGKPPKGCRRSKTKVAKRLKVADSV